MNNGTHVVPPDFQSPAFRVRNDRLCPICQKPDWCLSDGASWAICQRVESGHKWGEAGHFHRLGAPLPRPLPVSATQPAAPAPRRQVWTTPEEAEEAFERLSLASGHPGAVEMFASDYGLEAVAIPETWRIGEYPGIGVGVVYMGYRPDFSPVYAFRSLARNAQGKRESRFLHGDSSGALLLSGWGWGHLVIVAGQEKALAAYQAGCSVLCPFGGEKPLGEGWARFIAEKDFDRVVVANDADAAGAKANAGTVEALKAAGIPGERLAVVSWAEEGSKPGADLNDVLLRGGLDGLRAFLEAAPLVEKPETRLSVLSVDEIFNLQTPENDNLLADRLLARGEALGLFGQGGLGKSGAVVWLAICSIQGWPWCGLETHATGTRWLIFSPENSLRRTKRDLASMMRGMAHQERDAVNRSLRILVPIHDHDRYLNFGDAAAVTRMMREVESFQPDVVVYDPLIEFYAGDSENDSVAMRECFQTMMRIARRGKPDVAVVISHHARAGKAAVRAGVGFDAAAFGRGSKALYSSVRGAINMVPGDENDSDCLLIVPSKCNNGRLPEKRAVRRNPESLRLDVDADFSWDEWENQTADKRRPGSQTGAKVDAGAILRGVLTPGELTPRAAVTKAIMAAFGLKKTKAYEIVTDGLSSEIIRENMGALKLND